MLDFTKEDLYKSKKSEFDAFLEHVLVTAEERDALEQENLENTVTDDEIADFFASQGDLNDDFEALALNENKEEIEESSIFLSDKELGTPYEVGDKWKNLGVSPYYLFYYISRSMGKNLFSGSNAKLKKYLVSLAKVSAVTFLFSAPLVFFTEARFLFSLEVLAVISVLLFVASWLGLYVLKNPIKLNLFNGGGVADDSYVKEDTPLESVESYVGDMGSENLDEDEPLYTKETAKDTVAYTNESDEIVVIDKPRPISMSPIDDSPVNVKGDYDEFLESLKDVYMSNYRFAGKKNLSRLELVKSLSGYLISNDKRFGSWDVIENRSLVFNNILFTIYLGLVAVDRRFKDLNDENKIIVTDVKENPVMYKIVFETNEDLFKLSTLKAKEHLFKERLKSSDSDLETQLLISGYQGKFIIKLFKSSKGLISLGDILRYHDSDLDDKQAYEKFIDEDDFVLPMVLGLRDNEHPHVIDLAENTSVVVAGESGSGKSWGTFLMMLNLVTTNSPNDLNLMVLDRKNTVFWREFSRLPHVVGYHTSVPDYFDILKEIKDQMELRKVVLKQLDQEDWKGLRKHLKRENRLDELAAFPWLVVVIDEISNTMGEVRSIAGEDNKHILDGFVRDLATLAQEARSLGIKLILIGQRTIDKAMPKDNLNNSSMKFMFKLSANDMLQAFPDKSLKLPTLVGQALLKDNGYPEPVFLRTLTVGGINNEQIVNMFRMLAFDWHRRFNGEFIDQSNYFPFTFNRNLIQEIVAEDLKNEKYFLGGSGDDNGDTVSSVAELLISGNFTMEGYSDFGKAEIVKEDSRGNVVVKADKSNKVPEVVIKTDFDDVGGDGGFSELAGDVYSSYDDSDLEIHGDVADDSDDGTVLLGYDSDDLPIYGMPGTVIDDSSLISDISVSSVVRSESREIEIPVVKRTGSRVAHQGLLRKPKSNASSNRNGRRVVGPNSSSPLGKDVVSGSSKSNLPVAHYIDKYGEGVGSRFIRKEELEKVYTKEQIETALNNVSIVSRDGAYFS